MGEAEKILSGVIDPEKPRNWHHQVHLSEGNGRVDYKLAKDLI